MKTGKLVITISDVNSSKSYNVSKILKKIILWFFIGIFFAIAVSVFVISKLTSSVDDLTTQRDQLKKQNQIYNQQIALKANKITQLNDKVDVLENMLGLKENDKVDEIKQKTVDTITVAQKEYMLQTIPSGCPLKECVTTSKYGWRKHPVLKEKKFHNGTDLRAARRTPVYATADGVVRYVQDKNVGSFGRVVIIAHNFGFESVYGHLRFTDVKVGDVVIKGQQIARSGNSGRSDGPHLHYEVRHAGKIVDPDDYIKWDIQHYEDIFKKQRRVQWESLVKVIKNQLNK